MSTFRGLDPSKLHLKKEFTQIRKAAKGLPDPGTSSSWKSPIASSRSVEVPGNSRDSQSLAQAEKKVFLCNWKTHEGQDCNNGFNNDFLVVNDDSDESNGSDSLISRFKDTNLTRKNGVSKEKNILKIRTFPGLDVIRDESDEFSDDTESLSNSEKFQKITGASPLLLKLKSKKWSSSSCKMLRVSKKEEDSSQTCNSTPALSTNSYTMNGVCYPSSTSSVNDGDDELEDSLGLPGQQGCGIWKKKMNPRHKDRCRSCCSPSFSDTLRRTGSSMLCGSQPVYCRHKHSSRSYKNPRIASRTASRKAQGTLPLLKHSRGRSCTGIECGNDELLTDFGEIELEAQSRLDGRRWSTSCRSQGDLEAVSADGKESTPEHIQSLSYKYKPMFFDELVGQNIVVHSLMNAVKKDRIAPVYLFQGPRGTGKTSAARIFLAALNCVAIGEMKPCGYCKECCEFLLGKRKDLLELDAANQKGAEKIKYLLQNLLTLVPKSSSRYKVFVVDECQLLPSKTWLSLLKFLENPLPKVVFIFITTDLEGVPRIIQTRCQKYLFNRLKEAEIVLRLKKIASEENLDVESQALELIALNADGSLKDAETMLEQLSLMGKLITVDLVNELVGGVSDDSLLELLELALSSNTAETVKKARELLDLGADPIALMSQLASLIMDIIAGAYKALEEKYCDAFHDGRNLTEEDMERLKHALKLLSKAEKQLRVSSDRSTWFTATLLQLGSMPSPGTTVSGSSRRQSFKASDDNPLSIPRESIAYKQRSASPASMKPDSNPAQELKLAESFLSIAIDSEKLNDIWIKCIERCHSNTLKQLLYTHGKLLSITEVEGILVAYIAFGERDVKLRAERFLSSITNSIEMVLRRNVEVRIILLPEIELLNSNQSRDLSIIRTSSDLEVSSSEEIRHETPMQRIKSIMEEQRLETVWVQKSSGSLDRLKPERNQILPQEDTNPNMGSVVLKVGDMKELQGNQACKNMEACPVTPSLLHKSNFKNNNLGYEKGTGRGVCSLLFCWNTKKTSRKSDMKGASVRSRRSRKRGFSLFSECAKPRKSET